MSAVPAPDRGDVAGPRTHRAVPGAQKRCRRQHGKGRCRSPAAQERTAPPFGASRPLREGGHMERPWRRFRRADDAPGSSRTQGGGGAGRANAAMCLQSTVGHPDQSSTQRLCRSFTRRGVFTAKIGRPAPGCAGGARKQRAGRRGAAGGALSGRWPRRGKGRQLKRTGAGAGRTGGPARPGRRRS